MTTAIDETLLARNAKLVRGKMEAQLEHSLKKGADYIDQELAGPQNFLIRPIVKTFYNAFARPDLDSGSRGNLQVVLDAGMEIVRGTRENLDAVVDKYFHRYLKNDQTAKYCKKNHRDYAWYVENTKATFRAQLDGVVKVLGCMIPGEPTYDDLTVAVFGTREAAKDALMEQVTCMERGVARMEQDDSILDIPVGKHLIINVLKRGIKDEKEYLLRSIDETFR